LGYFPNRSFVFFYLLFAVDENEPVIFSEIISFKNSQPLVVQQAQA
jgi:hypothetical protein